MSVRDSDRVGPLAFSRDLAKCKLRRAQRAALVADVLQFTAHACDVQMSCMCCSQTTHVGHSLLVKGVHEFTYDVDMPADYWPACKKTSI